jgi:UDP-N-acetylmuramate: L-alanyl-gamma-D-glutamyl-meso-diaminopimelate ligase
LAAEQVKGGFKRSDLEVMTNRDSLTQWLLSKRQPETCFLLMSSGNYDGVDVQSLSNELVKSVV